MRLVFMGTPEFAVPSVRALLADGHEILSVVTRPDRPRRREHAPAEPSPVKLIAASLGLPVLQPVSASDPGFAQRLGALAPETIVVVAFGRILPPAVLGIPPRWCINLHASLLPRHRGAAPIARAIMAGDAVSGVTTMRMEEGLDTGDILLSRACPVEAAETTGDLTTRLAGLGAGLLAETLRVHARGALRPRPQDHSAATYAPPLRKEEGRLDLNAGAAEIASRVRACNPWPVAVAGLRGGTVQILRAVAGSTDVEGGAPDADPGRVIAAGGDRILVRCARGSVLAILELRFPGRRAMSARDAINGRLIGAGDLIAPAPGS